MALSAAAAKRPVPQNLKCGLTMVPTSYPSTLRSQHETRNPSHKNYHAKPLDVVICTEFPAWNRVLGIPALSTNRCSHQQPLPWYGPIRLVYLFPIASHPSQVLIVAANLRFRCPGSETLRSKLESVIDQIDNATVASNN